MGDSSFIGRTITLDLHGNSHSSEEDIYIPGADFITIFHPSIKIDGMRFCFMRIAFHIF